MALLLLLPIAATASGAPGVGIAAVEATDPVGGTPMPGFVFYPATAATSATTDVGPYEVAAKFGVPAQTGTHPLVVVSHGHGGSSLGHHDLATSLAAHGFLVATLEHPRDNHRDASGNGTPEVMAGRPLQVSALIDALLADPRWKALIDAERIGAAGFSAGGYTSLLLAGAMPRFGRFTGYCERQPEDREVCGLLRQLGGEAPGVLDELQQDFGRWGDTGDDRVRAAFVMAPQSIVFDAEGLAPIDVPVFLYYGGHDRVLLPQENAARIAPLIPTLAATRTIPEADHWVFLAPCSVELAEAAGDICRDPPGVDRAQVHRQVNADALQFFRDTLGGEVPASR
ncbi:alpha/beta hydrolase [Lysobacter sp. F6437]|uniref:alpha/beta hydrolase n=1 Tax=Lysobacter sp. F6437 TaxID=3459296 RepID=UPI00403DA4FB